MTRLFHAATPLRLAPFVVLAALAACSSPPPAAPSIAAGAASVNAAVAQDAPALAANEVGNARDKLERARMMAKSDPRGAARLAEEADVDAQLAAAKARTERARRAASEVEAGVQTLRDELNRAATPQAVRP